MVDTILELPTKEYELEVQNKKFKVKPLDEMCKTLLETVVTMGGKVRAFPNNNKPTAIFIDYEPMRSEFEPIEQYGHKVVFMEMNMHLNLLENHHKFEERLRKFVGDIPNLDESNFPKNYSKTTNKWVEITKVYQY